MIHLQCIGLLHSDICGSFRACRSPQLFAAYHVLLRLPMPRHSPCALFSLTFALRNLFRWSELCFLLLESFLLDCSIFLPRFLSVLIIYYYYLKFSSLHLLLLYSVFKVLFREYFSLESFLLSPTSVGSGGHKWTRTIDLTLIRRAL